MLYHHAESEPVLQCRCTVLLNNKFYSTLGYPRKCSPPSAMDDTFRIFRISKKNNSSFCRIPNPAHSKSCGIPEVCETLNGFPGIQVKFRKFVGNSWISSQAHRAFTT